MGSNYYWFIYWYINNGTTGMSCHEKYNSSYYNYFYYFTEVSMVDVVTRVTVLFTFEFPCIITLYNIKNQLDAALTVLFISHCRIILHVSDAFCVHHQEY